MIAPIAIAAWLEAGALAALLHRRDRDIDFAVLGRTAALTAVASAVAAGVGLAVQAAIAQPVAELPGAVRSAIVIVAVTAAYAAAFLGAARALRIAELPAIVGLMVAALRRPRLRAWDWCVMLGRALVM